jgi:acetyltransferase
VVERRSLPPGKYAHMAIYPWPAHLVSHWQLADGSSVVIRPIRPEDAELEQEFVRNLSEETKFFRFMNNVVELSQQMLVRFTQIDYDREMALVAVTGKDGQEIELGVCRYAINPDGQSCEFAVVVADPWRRQGVGGKLMNHLMDAARARGLRTMEGEVLVQNKNMLKFVAALGFSIEDNPEDPGIKKVAKRL